eukprot:3686846-Rhodomonas_salina.1
MAQDAASWFLLSRPGQREHGACFRVQVSMPKGSGRKREGAEGLPERKRWMQQGGCECGVGHKDAIEACHDFSTKSSVEATGKRGAAEQMEPVVVKNVIPSSVDGKVPDSTDQQPSADLNATAWDYTGGHAGALSERLRPGVDLRKLARESAEISWQQIEKWLPGDFDSLKAAAGHTNGKNLNMLLSTVLSSIQVLQTAITITDGAAAKKIFLSEGWHWSQHYVTESLLQRTTLFAWHLVAVRADELEKRWGIMKTRATGIA